VDVFKHKCAHNRILSRLEHCELCVQSARERAVAKAGAPGVMTRGGGLIGEDELRHRVERFPETLATEEPFKPGPYDALRAAGVAVAPSGLFVAVGDEAVAALSEHLRTTGGEVVKMAAQEPEQTYERYEGVSVFQSPPRHEVRGIRTKWTKTPAETIAAESPYTITRKDFARTVAIPREAVEEASGQKRKLEPEDFEDCNYESRRRIHKAVRPVLPGGAGVLVASTSNGQRLSVFVYNADQLDFTSMNNIAKAIRQHVSRSIAVKLVIEATLGTREHRI
jgi:hypothetical protein